MKLILETQDLQMYVQEIQGLIEFSTPQVHRHIFQITQQYTEPIDKIKRAFEVARDEIYHSFDTQNPVITISAEEALTHQAGICFAKAHALAAMIRGMGIPCGFCYQKILRKPLDITSGFALHGSKNNWHILFIQN